jgi:phosphatidylinositol glycan class O
MTHITHFYAGHEYRQNHPTLRAKLKQIDTFARDLVHALNHTLLVIIGIYGMDYSGDHGGESDDEIQAALWLRSRKGNFGRTLEVFMHPPLDAIIRSVVRLISFQN